MWLLLYAPGRRQLTMSQWGPGGGVVLSLRCSEQTTSSCHGQLSCSKTTIKYGKVYVRWYVQPPSTTGGGTVVFHTWSSVEQNHGDII